MIKINTELYNWAVLNTLYSSNIPAGKSPHIVKHLKDKIEKYLKSGSYCMIVQKLLHDWFFVSGSVSTEKLSRYLLDKNPGEYIRQYHELTQKLYPQCKGKDDQLEAHRRHINKEFLKIFDYTYFSENFRHEILTAMNVEVCPYCNRQYITNYKSKDGKNHDTAQIDHFHPKGKYAFLALSLYNFVPSCSICNSRLKGGRNFANCVNPIERGFGKKAAFEFSDICFIMNAFDSTKSIQYHLNLAEDDDQVKNSIECFHLDEVYQSHQDYVRELAQKIHIYQSDYIRSLRENFQFYCGSPYEMQCILFGNYLRENDLRKRPLAKLTRDLLLDAEIEIEE